MKRWPVVIFDLDGTLVDTIGLIVSCFQRVHREILDREISTEEIKPWIGRPLTEIYAALAPEQASIMMPLYMQYSFDAVESMQQTIPGMVELVRELHAAGVPLGVASSKRRATVLRSMEVADLIDVLPTVVALEDTEQHKPHPEPLLRCAELLGVDPYRAVYVGDAAADIEAAHAAGMESIAVTWGAASIDTLTLASPTHLVDSVASLRALLLSLS